jgi:hypothetical protein
MAVATLKPTFTGEARALAAAVDTIASFLESYEPARFTVDDAATLVSVFARGKRLCGAGETLSATRAAEGNAHLNTGHRDPAEWLAAVTGTSRGEANDVLRVGDALASQPAVEDALREGKLTPQRAKWVSEAAKANPGREEELVAGAQSDTFRQLKERCLRAKAEGRSAEEAARHRAALHAARRCRTWTDVEGAFHLEALLAPEVGATLQAALDAQADLQFQRARKSDTREPTDAYRADALVALITGQDLLPVPGRASKGRAHVQVRVDLDALRRGTVGRGECCEIPGVGPVPVQHARDLLGDALLDIIITDGVDVTTVARPRRNIPTPLATAIMERDQFCVVPGCGKRLGLEQDHWQRAVKDDGEASYENLIRLCRHHHYLRTHQGWVVSGRPGHWRFDPPARPKARRTPERRKRQGSGPPRPAPPDPPLFTEAE